MQLKQLEDATQKFWSEMHIFFDSMQDGIWIINADGITMHVNKALTQMTGLSGHELVGKHVSYPMMQGKYSACVTLRALEEKKPVTMFDDYANGKRFLNTSTPVFDETGKVWRVIACIRDMAALEELHRKLTELEDENTNYKHRIKELEQTTPDFLGSSPALRRLLQDISKLARVDSMGLILGETGTGKNLTATAIHTASARRDLPFVTVNCGAIPATLMESELFGYEKGAFTGASQAGKVGLFEAAKGGTILLDEVGELPLSMQVKLLHILDGQPFTRVGGIKPQKLEARVLAATNKSLEAMVKSGDFREDLYYRLHVITVHVPSLKERLEDIPVLARYFLGMANAQNNLKKSFHPDVLPWFAQYTWPGNVRELRTTVEYMVVMAEKDLITVQDLPERIKSYVMPAALDTETSRPINLKKTLAETEKKLIRQALRETGSTWKAAVRLGVSQSTVVRKAQRYKIGLAEIIHS